MIESRYGRCIIRRCNNDHINYFGLLCEELVVEILCLLPKRSLIRFKCVSKGWYCLISRVVVPRISPLPLSGMYVISNEKIPGIDNHTRYNIQYWASCYPDEDDVGPYCGQWPLGHHGVKEPRLGVLPFNPTAETLVDCCNGLFLFLNPSLNQYYLWCHMTRQTEKIPTFYGQEKDRHVKFAALAFNPRESVHYKIVHFRPSRPGSPKGIKPLGIFYSETGKWVEYDVQYPVDTARLVKKCIYLDGAIYRLSMSFHLLRYDLKQVNVTAIELPPISSSSMDDKIGCIGLSMGCLHHARNDGSTLLIWMLCDRRGGSEWVLMRSIYFQEFAKHPIISKFLLKFPATSGFQPLTFHPNSNAVFLWSPGVIFCYYLYNNKLEVLRFTHACSWAPRKRPPVYVFPYSLCLVPLKTIGLKHCQRNNM